LSSDTLDKPVFLALPGGWRQLETRVSLVGLRLKRLVRLFKMISVLKCMRHEPGCSSLWPGIKRKQSANHQGYLK
jgi:hypothetical protein